MPLPHAARYRHRMALAVAPTTGTTIAPAGAGGTRAVLEAAITASAAETPAALALVIETEGSTYVTRGALALYAFDTTGTNVRRTGWLSGGCLEPEIEVHARDAIARRALVWLELDTRDDDALFGGAALGCRGRLRIALLPLAAMSGFASLAGRWLVGESELAWSLDARGTLACTLDDVVERWSIDTMPPPWLAPDRAGARWSHTHASPPAVLVLGTGPEAPLLLPLLRALGCVVVAAESRPRWRANAMLADEVLVLAPREAIGTATRERRYDAALVMHHSFELDRDALEALAATTIPYVGLLGPTRRRDDLASLLPETARASLAPRLRSPIGMKLGGEGPEAIALSIAAQLQAALHAA